MTIEALNIEKIMLNTLNFWEMSIKAFIKMLSTREKCLQKLIFIVNITVDRKAPFKHQIIVSALVHKKTLIWFV